MDYKKLLEYYLTSDTWGIQKLMFFEDFHHYYDPYEGTGRSGMVCLCSEVYLEYLRKDAVSGGGCPFLTLTEKQFQKYFDKRYSEEQRFAVLFGLWWGLPAEHISHIGDLRQRKRSWELLNLFLCDPGTELDTSISLLHGFSYSGKYYAEIFEQKPQISPDPERRIVPVKEILPDGSICFDGGALSPHKSMEVLQ